MDLEAQSLLLDGEDRFETGSRSETQIGFFGVAGCGSAKLIRNLLQHPRLGLLAEKGELEPQNLTPF